MDEISTLCARVGEEKLRAMAAAFYRRVRVDDLIGPMYPPHDWEGSEKRLADFIVYRFGGPQTYIEERGHPRLRGRQCSQVSTGHQPHSPLGLAFHTPCSMAASSWSSWVSNTPI